MNSRISRMRMTHAAIAATLIATVLVPAIPGRASVPPTRDSHRFPGRLLFLNDSFTSKPEWTLWTVSPGSAHAVQITHSRYNIWSPAMSPDGQRIAFDRARGGKHSDVLVFTDPDGTHQRTVHSLCAKRCAFFDEMTWAPDGKTLLMLRATGVKPHLVGAIWSVRIDGTHPRQLTFPGESHNEFGLDDHHPSVSPDGSSFVYDRIDEVTGQHAPFIEPIGGGTAVRVPVPHRLNPGDPTWTPDGGEILFQSPPEPTFKEVQNLYTVRPDGTGLRQITHYGMPPGQHFGGIFHPSFSPDGRYIAASHVFSYRAGVLGFSYVILTANGHQIERIHTKQNVNNIVWGRRG
jgi:TolB protein